jgi:hypothetical protein
MYYLNWREKFKIFSHGKIGKQIQRSDAATISYTVIDRFTLLKKSKT